ncbi:MAG: hypothetical protein ABGW50_06345, partial [Thermococcus sp.]
GNYTLIYRVSYGDQSYTYTKKLAVSLGVRLVGVSVEKESVLLDDTMKGNVTIISERGVTATISCVAVINGTKSFAAKTREITLSPGTSVVQLSLPTSKPGNVSAVIGLSVHG